MPWRVVRLGLVLERTCLVGHKTSCNIRVGVTFLEDFCLLIGNIGVMVLGVLVIVAITFKEYLIW